MYIVNTTFVVEPAAHDRWYEFLTTKVLPSIREQSFDIVAFTRVLHEQNDGHYTYSLQVGAADIPNYERFMKDVITEYVQLSSPLFGEGALHFTTLLKKIEI